MLPLPENCPKRQAEQLRFSIAAVTKPYRRIIKSIAVNFRRFFEYDNLGTEKPDNTWHRVNCDETARRVIRGETSVQRKISSATEQASSAE